MRNCRGNVPQGNAGLQPGQVECNVATGGQTKRDHAVPDNILLDPLRFMQNNLVIPDHQNIGTTQQESGVKSLCLVRAGRSAKRHGQDVPTYLLRVFRGQTNAEATFRAFWCPYAQNETLTCNIDRDAALFFTATMDGCTLGVNDQGGGAAQVAHANSGRFGADREATYGLDGARQFQASEQANRIGHAIGGGAALIQPADYMDDYGTGRERKSTTFGIRTGGTWNFYTQTYVINGGQYFFRDCVQRI